MADITDGIQPRHVLFLEEEHGVAFALGEQRHQHIGAGHFVAAGILHMKDGALNDAMEPGGRLGVLPVIDHQGEQFVVDIFEKHLAQRVGIDIAGLHDLRGVRVVGEGEQQMLRRRIFVIAVAGEFNRAVQRLFQAPRQ